MANNRKTTGTKAASNASKTLRNKETSVKSKKAAGSALSQTNTPKRQTGVKAASAASKTLSDGRTSKRSKSAAGSALAQTPGKPRTSTSGRTVQPATKPGTISRAKSKSAVSKATSSSTRKK